MALVVAHFATGGGNGSAASYTTGNFSSTTGNLLVVGVRLNGNPATTITSVKNAAGVSFTAIASSLDNTNVGQGVQLFYLLNITGNATDNATVNFSPNQSFVGICCWEISGADTSSPFDTAVHAVRNSISTTVTSPAFTTAQANEIALVFVGQASGGPWTAGSGYTLDSASFPNATIACAAEYQIFNSIQTGVTATIVANILGSATITLATFKAAAPVTHSISGNCGAAGATVALGGTASASTTADGSGNYSFASLADGSYTVTPSLATWFFFPSVMMRVLAGADIINGNFGAVQPGSNTYAELAYDSFQRANENPLNPTNWTTVSGGGFSDLQIVSNTCRATAATDCAEEYDNATWIAAGQYVQWLLMAFASASSNAFMLLYNSADEATGYLVALTLSGGKIAMAVSVDGGADLITGTAANTFAAGDIIRLDKVGSSLSLYYNNTLIGTASDNTESTGNPGVDLNVAATTDIEVVDFVAGSITAPVASGSSYCFEA